jgi:hypothetical protein
MAAIQSTEGCGRLESGFGGTNRGYPATHGMSPTPYHPMRKKFFCFVLSLCWEYIVAFTNVLIIYQIYHS